MSIENAVRTYNGKGTLTFVDGESIRCDFECGQLSDARIVCRCLVKGQDNEYIMRAMAASVDVTDAKHLRGQTDEGAEFIACQLCRGRIPSKPHSGVEDTYVSLPFLAREVRVHRPSGSDSVTLIRFGLTNLEFYGTEFYTEHTGDSAKEWHRLQLPLDIGGYRVTLRPVADYQDRLQAVKIFHGIDVTSEAIVKLNSLDAQTEVVKIIDDLCLLLSLARGCLIQWIYRDHCSESGEILETYLRNVVTKSYSPLPVIASSPRRDIKNFIEKTFERFREQKGWWNLRDVILAYVDAKLEHDFLESRGLKIAILMDSLETHYLSQVDRVTIVEEEIFGKRQSKLKKRLRDVLKDVFVTATDQQIDLMAKHVQGLKYYPFRQALHDIFAKLGLEIPRDELQNFIENRNRLAHYGRFRTSNDDWQEYISMMHLVDKVLLAILAYDSYYLDWTKEPGWVGDTKMRSKLALKPRNDNL